MSLCLIIDNNGPSRNYPYIGEYSATDNCWYGQDNSRLLFHPAQKVFYLDSIKNFQTISNCRTFPPEHKIYLVKRYVEKRIRTLLNDKNNYVYFIATRFNDFYPSFWYIGNLWPMPGALYYMDGQSFFRDGCVMARPTDEFICLDEFLKQKGEF